MAGWRYCVVVALALCCVSVLGENGMPPVETIPLSSSATTLAQKPNELTTLEPPTTTAHKSTTTKTSSAAPVTTSAAPETTSTAPETTSTAPKTTTPSSKTTTAPPHTTTVPPPPPKPTPLPAPTTGVWNVTDHKTNITCIVLQMGVQFNVSYAAGTETKRALFNLPPDSEQSDGSCGNNSQSITLSWPKESSLDKRNNFTLDYALNTTSKQYYVNKVSIALVFDEVIFPNATSNSSIVLSNKVQEWSTGVAYSYRCKQPQSIKLTEPEIESASDNRAAEIIVSDLQEEAFRSEKGHQFSIAVDCATPDVPDVVPIAVGCALGGLVLVVLAAYLVGRRRSQARGYLSM